MVNQLPVSDVVNSHSTLFPVFFMSRHITSNNVQNESWHVHLCDGVSVKTIQKSLSYMITSIDTVVAVVLVKYLRINKKYNEEKVRRFVEHFGVSKSMFG